MRRSFTLVEIIIALSIVATFTAFITGNFINSLKKGRDARRRNDLQNISMALESFYNDNNRYPLLSEFYSSDSICSPKGCDVRVYMQKIPTDPKSQESYFYESDETGSYFRIYSEIENRSDQGDFVNQEGYNAVCNSEPCNYGLASTNVALVPLSESDSNIIAYKAGKIPTNTPFQTQPTQSPNQSASPPIFTDSNSALQQNLEAFELTRSGLTSNNYYPSYKYQTFQLECPTGYGVRDVQFKNKDNARKDVNWMGCSKGALSSDIYYGVCSFGADSPFNITLNVVCDKNYFKLPAYDTLTLATKPVNTLPDKFNIYNFSYNPGDGLTKTTKVNDQMQKISLTCPDGYKATDITCSTHFINYTVPYYMSQTGLKRLISTQVDSVRTASCLWEATGTIDQTYITTACIKQ